MKYLILLLLCGCASTPSQTVEIQPFTVHVLPLAEVRRQGFRIFNRQVDGFCNQRTRVIVVPFSREKGVHGEPLPNFEILAHELNHLPEFNGRWHK